MAGNLPTATPEPSGDKQPSAGNPSDAGQGANSRFPPSKRVEFAGALGLVVWVWSEMIETHEASKLCIQLLILVIFYVPVCYYTYRWIDSARTKRRISSARIGKNLFYILSVVTAIVAYRNTFSPTFSIVPREQYVEMKTPRHFIEWNINSRVILSPINVIMLAQFTNLRDRAMEINSYQFEGRTTNGTWEIMPTIDIKAGSMVSFVGTNWGTQGFGIVLGPVKEGDVVATTFGDDVFPEILNGKTITSGGTVVGVIFLEGPKQGFDGTIRCRIRDAVDREFVELVSPLQQTKPLQTTIPMAVNIGPGIPDKEDIKKLPVVPWSQEWKY
jgi:hypothetical protein